jgi:hypothetical protein
VVYVTELYQRKGLLVSRRQSSPPIFLACCFYISIRIIIVPPWTDRNLMISADIVEFVLYIQLVGSLALATSVLVVSQCHVRNGNRTEATTVQSSSIHGYKASQNGATSLPQYVLRPRLTVWLRQIIMTALLFVSIYTLVRNCTIGTDVQLKQKQSGATGINELPLYYAAHACFIGAIVSVLFLDDLSNVDKKHIQRAWLPVYWLLFVQCMAVFFCTGTNTALVQMLLSLGASAVAALSAYKDVSYPQVNPPTPEYTCGLLDALSFSHINHNIIIPGMQKASFEFNDVPPLSDADSAHEVWKRFRAILLSSKELNLWYALFQLVKWEWAAQGCFQLLGSTATYITPLALERILLHTANHGRDDDAVEALIPMSIELAVALLFVGPLLASIGDGQNWVTGR